MEEKCDPYLGGHLKKCDCFTRKVHIMGSYHHKNALALKKAVEILEWSLVPFQEAEVVFSADVFVDPTGFPKKKFVFGPHFSVFPNDIVRRIDNTFNNAIYIQPSEQCYDLWVNEHRFTNIPLKVYAFGVDTEKFKPDNSIRDTVLLYYKNRDPEELKYMENFLKSRGVSYKLFKYGSYQEEEYLSYLRRAKFAVWMGAHESQGFAVEEALSTNTPLLVWSVKKLSQEWSSRELYKNVQTPFSTIPYWDSRCGEYFHDANQLENTFDRFIQNISTYSPRDYIIDNLSMTKRAHALKKLVDEI